MLPDIVVLDLDCDPVTENGDGEHPGRSHPSMNGKRLLSSKDTIMESDVEELPMAKKSKTMQNGIDHPHVMQSGGVESETNATAAHNGSVDNVNGGDTHPNKTDSAVTASLSSNTTPTRTEVSNGGDNKTLEIDIDTVKGEPESLSDNRSTLADKHMANREETTLDQQEVKVQDCSSRPIKNDIQRDRKVGASSAGPAAVMDKEPEIITLSDSEDEFQEVLIQAMSLDSTEMTRCKLLKLYQSQLRAEDTKLILLRKLKQSLVNIEKQTSVSAATEAGAKVSSDMRSNAMVSSGQRPTGSSGNIPPPLKRGHHQQQHLQGQHGHFNQHSSSHHHKISANLHHPANHTQTAVDSRTKLAHQSVGSGLGSGGPPPLVNMAKSSPHPSATGSPSAAYSAYQSSQSATKKAAPVVPPPPPQLTAEQKLAAARIALKKQLEQALQQIPAAKPPPPEVNFLPSLASGEFVYLIGMEEVVKQLLSTDQKDVKFVFNPFSCVQCETDFTPVWKRDKPGSKNVICEKCITSNQKRILKKEHTGKLKAVFSKALQKEQEIERRIAAGSPLSDMPGLAAVTAVRQPQHHHQSSHSSAASHGPSSSTGSSGAATAAATSTPSMPQLTPQHAQSASPNTQTQLTPQLQQHHALLQAAQAEQMRAMLAAQMLPYQLYGVSNKQAADLHRQYFLDMINQNRSWKT